MIIIGNKCRGSCETCRIYYIGGCLAGHGDDDYDPVDEKWIACWKLQIEIAAMEWALEDRPDRKGADILRKGITDANQQTEGVAECVMA